MNFELAVQEIIEHRLLVSAKNKELDELKEHGARLEASLMESMANVGLTQAGSTKGTAVMYKKQKPVITNDEKFKEYVLSTGDLLLLQNRLGVKHAGELLSAGEEIPGVEVIEEYVLSITKKR